MDEHSYIRDNKKIVITYTTEFGSFFGKYVENVRIHRVCGKEENDILFYYSITGKAKLKLVDDELKRAYRAFEAAPKEILDRFPVAKELVYHKGDEFELISDLTLKTIYRFRDFMVYDDFSPGKEILDEVERLMEKAHVFLNEYHKLKKSRFWSVVRMILAQQRRELKKNIQRSATYRTIFFGVRFISMMTGNGDIGGDVVAGAGLAGLSNFDFSQWLDSVEIDGYPDFSADDKMDYLMQEGDGSDISFTGHTALQCTLCSCVCYRPRLTGDNSTSGLCKCGHTCAQHEWS